MPIPYGPEAMLRHMAWERAKGELKACVMASMMAEPLNGDDSKRQTEAWVKFNKTVEAFISDVEDNGLNE
jgi:hypothetical protein